MNYKRIYKLLFIILAVGFFISCKNTSGEKEPDSFLLQGDINNQLTDQHIQILGSRMFMIPPKGFTFDSVAMSFDSQSGAKILIMDIIGGDFEKNAIDLTEENLQVKGIKPLRYSAFTLNGYSARYAIANTAAYSNIVLFAFGDSTFCATVSAMYFPSDFAIKDEINKAIASIVYDKNTIIDPFEFATFSIDPLVSNYRFLEYSAGTFIYALTDKSKLPSGDLKDNISIKQFRTSSMIMNENLTEENLSSFERNGFVFSDTIRMEYSTIDGYEAIETATFGTLNDKKNMLYTLTLINNTKNVGIIVNKLMYSDFEYNLSEAKKFTHSINFK